jgi:hypothetical protein
MIPVFVGWLSVRLARAVSVAAAGVEHSVRPVWPVSGHTVVGCDRGEARPANGSGDGAGWLATAPSRHLDPLSLYI